jgi:creatinine amidohydrolase
MLWHEQSWPAIDGASRELPVVIPLGACEQHGRHLPLFVDTIQVSAVAQRVNERMGASILMAPVLGLGSSHHHLDFPGTISVRPSLYGEIIKDVARSVIAAGFKRIFFLNGHGGNEIPAAAGLTDLIATDDRAESCYLTFASWWQVGKAALDPKRHGLKTPAITHACEYETSMLLFLRPDLVRMGEATAHTPVLSSEWHHSEYGRRVSMYRRFHRLTQAGSMGDPTAATAEKGRSMLDTVVDDVVKFLGEFATWPELPVLRK